MKKAEGFKEQISVIIPDFVADQLKEDPISGRLYLTDIGFFPAAEFHHRVRKKGSKQFILIYCIAGDGWISLGGEKMKFIENQYFIIPPGVPHAYGSGVENPWSIYWVHFTGELASYFFDTISKPKTIAPSNLDRIEDRIQIFHEIIKNLEMGYSTENVQYANICLLHFLSSFKYVSQFRQIRKTEEQDVVAKSINFMKRNLNKKYYLKELAKEVGLSTSHFSLLFRERTRRSPMDYFAQLRVQRACQYLDNSILQVSDIALKVGFKDPFHFSRIFKQVMGVSPVHYRKKPKG